MGFSWKEVKSDKIANYSFKFTLVVIIASLFFLFFSWSKLPPEVPLFYSLPWGKEQLVPPYFLWFLPLSSHLLLLLNSFLASYFSEDKFLVRVLMISAGLYALLTSLTLWRIITLIA